MSSINITDVLAFALLTTGLGIVSAGSIQGMIRLYQAQSLILGVLTMLASFPSIFARFDTWSSSGTWEKTTMLLPVILLVTLDFLAALSIALGLFSRRLRNNSLLKWLFHLVSVLFLVCAGALIWLSFTSDLTRLKAGVFLGFAVLLPLLLLYIVEPLLARATVIRGELEGWQTRLLMPFRLVWNPHYYGRQASEWVKAAVPIWLEHRPPARERITAVIAGLFFVAVAGVLSIRLYGAEPNLAINLSVSLALVLVGIFAMVSRQDLISQVLGLLVMEHGLFVAITRVMKLQVAVPAFVISLFLYVGITLLILVILTPELHARSNTISVEDQNSLRG